MSSPSPSRRRDRGARAAPFLVVLAVSLAAAGGLELVETSPAAPPLPATSQYGVLVLWAKPPETIQTLRCYVLRQKSRGVKGVWLCG